MRQVSRSRVEHRAGSSVRRVSRFFLRSIALVAILTLAVSVPPSPAAAGDNFWSSGGPGGGPILSLAIDPKTPTTLYAGTHGAGVFKSIDGGATWNASNVGLTDVGVYALAIEPKNPSIIYASTINAGVFKSADGGATWNPLLIYGIAVLAIDPKTPTTLYAGRATLLGGGLSKSLDGGITWNDAGIGTSERIVSLAIDPVNPSIVYAGSGYPFIAGGTVFKTLDGGAHWSEVISGLPNSRVNTLLVNPVNSAIVYVGTDDGVFKSTNSGGSWSEVLANSANTLAIDPTTPSTIYAGGGIGVSKSTNSGGSWSLLNTGLANTTVKALAIHPVSTGTIYAATEAGVFKSANSAANWGGSYAGLYAADVRAVAVAPATPTTIYAGTRGNGAARSMDGGRTWSTINNGLSDSWITTLAVDPIASSTLYAGTRISGAFKSTNAGTNWIPINDGLFSSPIGIEALAIDPVNPSIVYAGTSFGVFKTVNAGGNWIDASAGLTNTFVADLAINPTSPTTLYALTDGGVFKSTNGGGNWSIATLGLTGVSPTVLAIDPQTPSTLYAGTYDGLFKTTNGGASWNQQLVGSGNIPVVGIAIDSQNASTVYVGRADGVWKSPDGGLSWSEHNLGLANRNLWALAIDPVDPAKLYAGTYGGGVVAFHRFENPKKLIKVLDAQGQPISGARVYRNGRLAADSQGTPLTTDAAGNLRLPDLKAGDKLVALASQYRQPTVRDQHGGWAYQVNITNMNITSSGLLQTFVVTDTNKLQTLKVKPGNPLVLFNLVVSIEWDADIAYTTQISEAMRSASDFLYDMTDGQMAFGQVAIYDNGAHWADADIQIATNNVVRPHAYIGGIGDGDRSHVIRVGRAWDGNSGNTGSWSAPDGYRTLAHEFGHYALHLYDQYFAFVRDAQGNVIGERPASCTGPSNRNRATEATNASVMDYQYASTELAMRGVPGLWSNLCEATAQWQINGESDWETLARKYADAVTPARWQFTTPADRGGVLAGPTGLPATVLDLPQIVAPQSGASGPPRRLTVLDSSNRGFRGAIVALYKQRDNRVIGQGFTDNSGRLDIYGAEPGDIVRAASFDGGRAGSVVLGAETNATLRLGSVGALAVQAAGAIPHIQVVATPAPPSGPGEPQRIELLVALKGFGPGADPSVVVTAPGSEQGFAPTLSYSPTTDAYEGRISFSANQLGLGHIRTVGSSGNSLVRLQSTYRLQRVINSTNASIFSNDGNLELHLDSGDLPGSEAYAVVMPPGAIPGPLPAGLTLVGDPYDVTVSGAATLQKPAVLSLRYDKALVSGTAPPAGLKIYRWNPNSTTWQEVGGMIDPEHRAVTAQIRALGTYVLLAPPGEWQKPANPIFLPLVRQSPS
jgi:photosystem II stability/assembly factor-like uncharacterized protein